MLFVPRHWLVQGILKSPLITDAGSSRALPPCLGALAPSAYVLGPMSLTALSSCLILEALIQVAAAFLSLTDPGSSVVRPGTASYH